jgi:hypothetical protein
VEHKICSSCCITLSLCSLSLIVNSLSVSFSLPSPILLLIVASRWWLSHC